MIFVETTFLGKGHTRLWQIKANVKIVDDMTSHKKRFLKVYLQEYLVICFIVMFSLLNNRHKISPTCFTVGTSISRSAVTSILVHPISASPAIIAWIARTVVWVWDINSIFKSNDIYVFTSFVLFSVHLLIYCKDIAIFILKYINGEWLLFQAKQ